MRIKDFVFASKVSEATSLLREIGDSAFLSAGGTSTYFISSKTSKVAIDISRLSMKEITLENKIYKIGALTTINDLQKYKGKGWMLDRVAKLIANQQIRNISTIGGNMARIFYWSDIPVALLALGGSMKLSGISSKHIKIAEAYSKPAILKDVLNSSIIEYFEIPALAENMGFSYQKVTRTSGAFSSLTASAFIEIQNEAIKECRVAIGSVLPFPERLNDVEEFLKGKKPDCSLLESIKFEKLGKLRIVPKEGMSEEYCKHLIKVKVRDAICEATKEAMGGR